MNRNSTDNPYANNDRRCYPSQAVDYFSLSAGGAYTDAERQSQQRQGQQPKNQGNVPYFYQDTRGSFRGGRGGFAGRGKEFHRRPYKPHNRNNYGGGGGGVSNRMNNDHFRPRTNEPPSKEDTYAMYFHPSMLEDPWKELMNRLQAIRKSAIDMEKMDNTSNDSDVDEDGGGNNKNN